MLFAVYDSVLDGHCPFEKTRLLLPVPRGAKSHLDRAEHRRCRKSCSAIVLRQDKEQAESTGRNSIDRLHHRGPWLAEQLRRRSIVMCDQCTM